MGGLGGVERGQPRWPWLCLVLALAWAGLVRVPLVLNAANHLDSDLAVDGLTLAEAVRGHWRWHYPGTPHMGTGPVLLSWIPARIWGANPIALVSGGVIAYELVVLAVFSLAWSAFGPRTAAWSLVPLAFASTGTVWLSGRITGGHLLTVAWHAAAFAMLCACVRRGGRGRAAMLGLWCGLGLYLDQMFLFCVAFLVTAALVSWLSASEMSPVAYDRIAFFVLTFLLGYAPHWLGAAYEPHDAYKEQFQTIFQTAGAPEDARPVPWSTAGALGLEHGRILALECLPRLVAGHLLPRGESEPSPAMLLGKTTVPKSLAWTPIGCAVAALALPLFLASMLVFVLGAGAPHNIGADAVRWGLSVSAAAVSFAFVLNLNIYNSDNYRYLVFLLVPWALGFGLFMDWLARRGRRGALAAAALALGLALLMTLDTVSWYRQFGWVDDAWRPVRKKVPDDALAWLEEHPKVEGIFGGYWDVYRLSFLTGGRVRGVPYPIFPDRFPEWSQALPGHRPKILVVRRTAEGNYYRATALRQGGRELMRKSQVAIYEWP
jgi:hypothetical protein